jgi:16S rRNA C967 or C1407 C5-methylase (RsmB/RsmF family)
MRVTGFDATQWCLHQKEAFDCILLDVPCSSERHVLIDSKELARWTPARSKNLAARQWAILASALEVVKVGGIIVYSTCSISPQENDEVLKKLDKKRGGRFEWIRFQNSELPVGVERTDHGYQLFPDRVAGIGPIFWSVLKRIK